MAFLMKQESEHSRRQRVNTDNLFKSLRNLVREMIIDEVSSSSC